MTTPIMQARAVTGHESTSVGTASPAAGVDAVLYLDGQLRVVRSSHPGPAVVRLIGELDAVNTSVVIETLRRARRAGRDADVLLIDVEKLGFADVGGTRLLTGLCRDGRARLVNTPDHMRRLLDLLRLPGT
ncbi:STAS domain-containing protein [Nonomuraea sp. NPDC050383]|uniref:STAS domain-containing protein n=1 Tax=Nonomuraea sp. NPDC050383 TaxID=3364362 RepID=UPI0037AB4A3D